MLEMPRPAMVGRKGRRERRPAQLKPHEADVPSILNDVQSPELLSALIASAAFFVLGALFMLAEAIRPARRQWWANGFRWNTIAIMVTGSTSVAMVLVMAKMLAPLNALRPSSYTLGDGWRTVVFFVLADLTRYLGHRLMHVGPMWRTHRFHHSIEVVHWYAGNRASLCHLAVWTVPMALIGWWLDIGLLGLTVAGVVNIFWQHLMHANLALPARLQRTLELLVATPRYHHIHHSTGAEHRAVNMTNVLTLWDRLGGTYRDPDRVDATALRFGRDPDDRPPSLRQLLGV
jgi:sterol desaturase/sphingolipid hydroxylase (fatty acid hydroxylase superfamily)